MYVERKPSLYIEELRRNLKITYIILKMETKPSIDLLAS